MSKMARLIDADELITTIQGAESEVAKTAPYDAEWFSRMANRQFEILGMIDLMPTVDAVPVVHGAWVNVAGCRTICNNCREYPLYDYFGRLKLSNYCHNCGATMDLEVKDA